MTSPPRKKRQINTVRVVPEVRMVRDRVWLRLRFMTSIKGLRR